MRTGPRAYLLRIEPEGVVESAPEPHGGGIVAVADGLVQVLLRPAGRPVLRAGDALLADESAVSGFRNLADREAVLFWLPRDRSRPAAG